MWLQVTNFILLSRAECSLGWIRKLSPYSITLSGTILKVWLLWILSYFSEREVLIGAFCNIFNLYVVQYFWTSFLEKALRGLDSQEIPAEVDSILTEWVKNNSNYRLLKVLKIALPVLVIKQEILKICFLGMFSIFNIINFPNT